MNKPQLYDLESIKTKEGELIPIYKDWEDWHEEYIPKMAYITTIAPGIEKGPILHHKRKGLMMAYSGHVVVECKIGDEIISYLLNDGKNCRKILLIPAGIPNKICNLSSTSNAIILNLPSKAWHPDDEDTQKFSSWEELNEQIKG